MSLFYLTSHMHNMFQTLIYPSSGACDYSVELPHFSYCSWFDVCWSFGVVGLEWYPCCRLHVTNVYLKLKNQEMAWEVEVSFLACFIGTDLFRNFVKVSWSWMWHLLLLFVCTKICRNFLPLSSGSLKILQRFYIYFKNVSSVTFPCWSSMDRHRKAGNVPRMNTGVSRKATRWQETHYPELILLETQVIYRGRNELICPR